MDQRAIFFLGAALVSALLIALTDGQHRWVPIALVVIYVVLALASWADRRGRDAETEMTASATPATL